MFTNPKCTTNRYWSTISASTIALLLSASTTTTALPSNHYGNHATTTTTTTTITPPRGLSIKDYGTILSTDVEKIFNFNPDDDPSSRETVIEKWNKATIREWERATKVETKVSQLQKNNDDQLQQKERRLMRGGGDGVIGGKQQQQQKEQKQTTTTIINTNSNFPYVVCLPTAHPSSSSSASPPKKPSGYHITTTLSSHFNNTTHFTPLVNDHHSKTCIMASLPSSLAMTAAAAPASMDMAIQPLLPQMKIAVDTIGRLIRNESLRLRVMFCPGVVPNSDESESTMVAEEIMKFIISSIVNGDDDEEMEDMMTMMGLAGEQAAAASISKDRLLRKEEEEEDSKQNVNNENNNNSDCHDIYQQIRTSSGYKGEYVIVDLSSSTTPTPTSCIISLLSLLSTKPQICLLDAMLDFKLANEPSQWILQSGVEEKRPWFDVGLDGRGQVVAVSDTGVDLNNCYFFDRDHVVTKDGTIQTNGRKVIQYTNFANDYDEHGHGTHVCGTIAGRRSMDGIREDTGSADGMARMAKLAMFDVGADTATLDIPRNIEDLFTPGVDAGAHLHSASWGSSTNAYDFEARDFDSWIVDHPDFLTMVAAGNSGHGSFGSYDEPHTVHSPGTAKNIVTVGATESAGDELTKSQMEGYDYLAYFSSRGPTADNRTKPDLVAPGYNILSAKAQQSPDTPPSCDDSDGLQYMTGTSMATPAVSGMAALVRQYFEDGWYDSDQTATRGDSAADDETTNKTKGFQPSAALIKAILLNGAQQLKGINNKPALGSITPVEPYDQNQGFGRLNLLQSLFLDGVNDFNMFVKNDESVDDGDSVTYTATVPENCPSSEDDAMGISVTLVWTDPVGYPYCAKCLMNDLDLVVLKNGHRVYANGGDEETRDSLNNAERVQTPVTVGDVIEISVVAENLMMESQRYALVATGCFEI